MADLFPAFYFHKTEGQRLFESARELAAAGAGWSDTQPPAEPAGLGQTAAREEVIATPDDNEPRLKRKPPKRETQVDGGEKGE